MLQAGRLGSNARASHPSEADTTPSKACSEDYGLPIVTLAKGKGGQA